MNLTIIGVSLYAIYKIFTNTKFAIRLTDALKRQIVKQQIVEPVSFEELVMVTGGYEVSRFDISEGSPIVNRALRESGLRDLDIFVLAIERGETAIPNPSADTKILLGDRIICFGRLENIREGLSGRIGEVGDKD